MDRSLHRRTIAARSASLGFVWGAWVSYAAVLPQLQDAKSLTTQQLGALGAIGLLATIVGQLLLAPLGDRIGERVTVIAGAVVFASGLVLFATSRAWVLLVAGRAAGGLALGLLAPVLTAGAMRAAGRLEGARVTGWLQAGSALGLALGPILVLSLADLMGPAAALAMAGLIAGAALIVIQMWTARTTLAPPERGHSQSTTADDRWNRRAFVAAVLISSAFMAAVGAYDSLWSRYLTDLGASSVAIGLSYMAFAVPFAVAAPAAGRWIAYAGVRLSAVLGGTVMLAAIVGYATLREPSAVVAMGIVESTGQAFVSIASGVALTAAAPLAAQATAHGVAAAAGTAVAASMAGVGGGLYATGGPALLFGVTGAVYAALLTTGLFIYPQHVKQGDLR